MRILFILGLCCIANFSFSQKDSWLSSYKTFQDNKIRRIDHKAIDADSYFEKNKSLLGLGEHDELVAFRSFKNKDGREITRYRQYHNGIEVLGSNYIAHQDQGKLQLLSGVLYPGIQIQDSDRSKSIVDLDRVKVQLLESMKNFEYPEYDAESWSFVGEDLVIVDKAFPEYSGEFTLCRHYNVNSSIYGEPFNEDIYVELETGKLICHFSKVHFDRVKGVLNTKYYGEKEVYIDSLAPDQYLLKDDLKSVYTLNADRDTFINDSKYWNQVNDQQNEVAGDVHYGASSYYDMMKSRYGWEGLDGEGHELTSVMHVRGKYYVNAYWDGERANFGNGDCDRYNPLTTLTIVGHEFIHGFTDHTSDLIYRNESGALNEAISDIFGKALQFYYNYQDFTWLIGDQIRKNNDVNYFRNMQDPNDRHHPKFYGGHHWRTGSGDNGGVHSNSGVLNHWFYLLAEGGQGYNEENQYYEVNSMGFDKALDLVFEIQTAYLTENSNYVDAMNYSIAAAESFYGLGSAEYISVIEAWKAVGLYQGIDNYDLSIEYVDSIGFAVCKDDPYIPSYIIVHKGQQPIPVGESLNFTLEDGYDIQLDRSIPLESEFKPGDTLLYELDIDLSEYLGDQNLLTAHVIYEQDAISLNNHTRHGVRKSNLSGMDINLITANFDNAEDCGEHDLSLFRFQIRNEGCQTIPEDEHIFFNVSTDMGDFMLSRKFFIDINPGTTYGSTVGLSFIDVPKNFKVFDVEAFFPEDLDESNNRLSGEVSFLDYVPSDYIETFETDDKLSFLDIDGREDYVVDSLIYWNSNRVLAFAAVKEHSNYKNCELDQDFHDQYYYPSTLSFCVDTREIEEPVFSFDMMQKRNSNPINTPVNPLYSSMFELSVDDENQENLLVYGQAQSSFIHHEYPLPENYVGLVSIDITNISGAELWPDVSFFQKRDLVALDNLRIHGRSKLFNDTDAADYLVFPNPVSGLLRILNKDQDQFFSIRMYNTVGQLMYTRDHLLNQYWIDMSEFPEAVYKLCIYENDERVSVRSIVVAHKN